MTTTSKRVNFKRHLGLTLAEVLAGLGITAALGAGPVLASEKKMEEAYESHGYGSVESKFYGVVQKIPSDRIGFWTVNGREIQVNRETRITEEYGKAAAGAFVEVEGSNTGKVFSAKKIEVKRAKK